MNLKKNIWVLNFLMYNFLKLNKMILLKHPKILFIVGRLNITIQVIYLHLKKKQVKTKNILIKYLQQKNYLPETKKIS